VDTDFAIDATLRLQGRDRPCHETQDLALSNTVTAIVPAIEPTPDSTAPSQVALREPGRLMGHTAWSLDQYLMNGCLNAVFSL
jgi:hypothetical protein